MATFFDEISNGNLGEILGSILGEGYGSSGGGLEDIIESMRKKMGGETAPMDEEPISSGGGLEDIMKEIKKKMGGETTPMDEEPVSSGGLEDIMKEIRRRMGGGNDMVPTDDNPLDENDDIFKEIRKKNGFDPEETTKSSSDVFEDLEEDMDEPISEEEGIGGMGDINDVFKKLGIDPSNLGGLAESVLKTIGLAGNAI